MKQTKRMLLLEVDEKGVAIFATLLKNGWVIIADGISAGYLRELGVEYIPVEQETGGSDFFSLNLLKKGILAGILSSRDDPKQMKSNLLQRIEKIDMVVASIPTYRNPSDKGFNTTLHALILRSTQNAQNVTLVIDPNDYSRVAKIILENGDTFPEMKLELASKACSHLASHCSSLGRVFNHQMKGCPKLLPE